MKKLNNKKISLLFPVLLICAEIAAYLSNDLYLPALPTIMREFNISYATVQMTLTSWFFGSMSMQLIVGPFSDRFGRKPILLTGVLLFIAGSFLCAFTSDINFFVLGRFIQGSSICFIIVAGYASIHELYDQTHSIHLLALMGSITVLAPALGPYLGSLILSFAGWRWMFWLLFIFGCFILIALFYGMKESLPLDKRHPLQIPTLFRQYINILKTRRFIFYLLTFCFIFCGFIAWLVSGPFFVIDQFKYSPTIFGICQIIIFGFYILSNRFVKKMMEKIGVNKLINYGLLITFSGAVFSCFVALMFPKYLSGLIISLVIFSFGFGFTFAPLQRLTIESSQEPMGSRMAILSAALGAAGLSATLLVSLIYNGELISLAGILLFAAICSLVCYRLGKQSANML